MTNDEEQFSREWLETNKTGAFLAGSVAGASTRQYHNLFMVPRHPPVDRVILVNNCETFLHTSNDRFALSTNLYPDQTVQPTGHRWIEQFQHTPWPTWTYRIEQADLTLQKEVFLVHERNIALLKWTIKKAPSSIVVSVYPKLTGREYTSLHRRNPNTSMSTRIDGQQLSWNPYEQIPRTQAYHNGTFHKETIWYEQNQYPERFNHEETREEDWWTPGRLEYRLTPGADDTAWLMFSTDPTLDPDFESLERQENQRRSSRAEQRKNIHVDPPGDKLLRAAEDFTVNRDHRKTIFAGFPWFTDWGRDTFISLTGLLLVPGHDEIARDILDEFSDYISGGLVPNRFPETGEDPEYNTIDASLWYIHALGKYLTYSGDESFVTDTGWKAIQAIFEGYRHGTKFRIGMDDDGLIHGGTPETQLTWMDAKVEDHAFTPRDGKPVEIQALWIRALDVAQKIGKLRGQDERVREYRELRERAIQSFRNRFWYEQGGYLYDVVDGHTGNDTSLRPNQIYAAMFDGILPAEKRRSVVDRVQDKLLTPYGLRTLSPDDPDFHGQYSGDRWQRDQAYHQGTVWPFLLGGFVSAWVRVREDSPSNRKHARVFFDDLETYINNQAAIGQVSEIFDGAAPHKPKGCFAQAWSVAEPLRALFEDVHSQQPS